MTTNITVSSIGSITVTPDGLLDLFGNLTINSGGTFTNNGGTRIDGDIFNSGTIINNDSIFIDNNGNVTNESGGTFTSNGYAKIDGRRVELTRSGLLRADSLLPAFFEPEYRDVRYT